MKILVTGANGLVGQKLIALLNSHASVTLLATARKKSAIPLLHGTWDVLDIANSNEVESVFEKFEPDCVINTAAMTQVDQCETDRDLCWNINVNAVDLLVKASARFKTHLIHLSTDFVFDGSKGPLDELALPNPISYYGESKLAAEKIIQRSEINWTILRTALVYGVLRDLVRSNIVLWVKKNLEEGKPINVVNDQWRTPTLAEDMAMGCYLAAIKKATGLFHVSGSEIMTPYDIAIQTANFFSLKKDLIHKTDSTQFRQPAMRPPRTGFIIEKAKRELGFKPHTFAEGLALIKTQLAEIN
jgi:dTDP-4-dehydrorhamnose reductase